MSSVNIKIGIIGGTGFNETISLDKRSTVVIDTPYGKPSDSLVEGLLFGTPCAFLPRHGSNHSHTPSIVNYRANLWALKHVGCTHVLAITSCGSLQSDIKPGDVVVIDQFFDRTTQRIQTFYDGKPESPKGVLHIPMNKPFCEKTRQILIKVSMNVAGHVHNKGTVVTIEGNRYSSQFESKYFHELGLSVINMTTVPEVVLAKELGLCYAVLAMVTDFDSWRDDIDGVDSPNVISTAKSNSIIANQIIVETVKEIAKENWTDIIKMNMVSKIMLIPVPVNNRDNLIGLGDQEYSVRSTWLTITDRIRLVSLIKF